MTDPTVSSVILTAFDGYADQLWLVVPGGLAIALIVWGVVKAKNFTKRLAG
jgi:hypothetical protein